MTLCILEFSIVMANEVARRLLRSFHPSSSVPLRPPTPMPCSTCSKSSIVLLFHISVLFQQLVPITETGNALSVPAVCPQHAQGAVCARSHVSDHIRVHARSSWRRAPGEIIQHEARDYSGKARAHAPSSINHAGRATEGCNAPQQTIGNLCEHGLSALL